MPRQHKVDPGDDSYICDTDGYALQAGCYYHIQLPDGRTLAMMPPNDSDYSYLGNVAFGVSRAACFYFTEDSVSPWQDRSVKFLIKKEPTDSNEHSLYLADDVVWDVPHLASPLYANRTSGRTVLWFPDYAGTLKVGDKPFLVDQFGDEYYALMPNGTKRPQEDWWKARPDDIELQFVYKQDV
ncbi:hypothetical protein N7466_009661 [Penicillium verhagenii]|uniref:uncharacterized protein n=1 Tax=Penicillium verhagenii TaxID=1562060 RepID=UPI0025458B61|nr:uncharacterized protein N7466_009661 [Penicillium verhagenii]KAJ5921335.1 hypothetical protein N7466_009661 [Penicillium verhagenii]